MDKQHSLKLETHYVSPDTLNPAPYNPRTWSEEDKEKLKDSLDRFGFVDPLIVNSHPDRQNVLIGGHFRLAVAKEIGMAEVPVVYLNLPEEKERELNIRLNKNTGRFDFELLKDFDLELLLDVGFGEAELGAMWDLSFTTEEGAKTTKDENGKTVPRVKSGEVWQLGDHRLICGDSTDPGTLKRLMRGEQAAMLYSDPPYNIAFDYASGLTTKGKYGGSYADTKSEAEYRKFLKKALANGMAHAAKDVHVFTWNDQNHIGLLQELYPELGITPKRVVFWLKNNFNMTPGVAFNKAVEPCVYGTRGKPFLKKGEDNLHEILNRDIATGSRAFDDIWDYMELWLEKRKAATEYLHPTEKPVTLHERPLRRCTRPGDIVLDLFAGSGSLLTACEQMKRKAYLVEIDPVFATVIVNRYEELTGKTAEVCHD